MNLQPLRYLLISSLFILLVWAFSPAIKANFPFTPYQATYSVSWFGIPAGESIHQLSQSPDGHYRFETKTIPSMQMLPYHYYESTDFSWKNGLFIPQSYHYNRKEGKRHKKGEVTFDWNTKMLYSKNRKEPWESEITEGLQDKLTQTLSLRYALKAGTPQLHYLVAEEDKIKDYVFKITGEEYLKTKIGSFQTVKIEHISRKGARTTLWLAKKLDFLPVKMTQIRQRKIVANGEILTFTPRKT